MLIDIRGRLDSVGAWSSDGRFRSAGLGSVGVGTAEMSMKITAVEKAELTRCSGFDDRERRVKQDGVSMADGEPWGGERGHHLTYMSAWE